MPRYNGAHGTTANERATVSQMSFVIKSMVGQAIFLVLFYKFKLFDKNLQNNIDKLGTANFHHKVLYYRSQ